MEDARTQLDEMFDEFAEGGKKAKLTASIKERSPSNPAAVAALAKLRFS